jgi:hypothetical protein
VGFCGYMTVAKCKYFHIIGPNTSGFILLIREINAPIGILGIFLKIPKMPRLDYFECKKDLNCTKKNFIGYNK